MSGRDYMKWFEDARFGMFVHWGVYALIGRGEWVRSNERMTAEEYLPYVERFQPQSFDADAIASLAAKAGMKYLVFTARHHDGYCMFDTETTDYQSMHYTGHDFVREMTDACRRHGLKTGLYYSLIDWHHPDYPHYGDRIHPQRDDPAWKGVSHDFDRYLRFMHEQIRELCTNYGKIDLLWLDYSYDNMRAETWRGEQLVQMVRRLQPGIILNNRLEASGEGFGSLLSGSPAVTAGDFVSPEQIIPPQGITDCRGRYVPWEACVTMNNHWGYCAEDHYYKPAGMLIRKLVECVSKNGNMILNIGPDGDGAVPAESIRILEEIAGWMKHSGESVHGCGAVPVGKPEYGRITGRDDVLYYHVLEGMIGGVPLNGLKREQIRKITLLKTGEEIPVSDSWITGNYPDLVFADLGEDPRLPDDIDTVLRAELTETSDTPGKMVEY